MYKFRAGLVTASLLCLMLGLVGHVPVFAEDGYELWLRYLPESNPVRLAEYRQYDTLAVPGLDSASVNRPVLLAAKREMNRALAGIVGLTPEANNGGSSQIVIGTPSDSPLLRSALSEEEQRRIGSEGFALIHTKSNGTPTVIVVGGGDAGGTLWHVPSDKNDATWPFAAKYFCIRFTTGQTADGQSVG